MDNIYTCRIWKYYESRQVRIMDHKYTLRQPIDEENGGKIRKEAKFPTKDCGWSEIVPLWMI